MKALDPHDAPERRTSEDHQEDHEDDGEGGGHSRWMMIACCIPMVAIAVVVALSGAGFAFLFIALGCTAMMALMMGGMSHGHDKGDSDARD